MPSCQLLLSREVETMTLFLITHPDGTQAVIRDDHAQNAKRALSTMSNDDNWLQSSVIVLRNEGEQECILTLRRASTAKHESKKRKKSDKNQLNVEKSESTEQE